MKISKYSVYLFIISTVVIAGLVYSTRVNQSNEGYQTYNNSNFIINLLTLPWNGKSGTLHTILSCLYYICMIPVVIIIGISTPTLLGGSSSSPDIGESWAKFAIVSLFLSIILGVLLGYKAI